MAESGSTFQLESDALVRQLWTGLPPEKNTDFERRIALLPDQDNWQQCNIPGLQVRVLEFCPEPPYRLNAQLRLLADAEPVTLEGAGIELGVIRGRLQSGGEVHHAGFYLRTPLNSSEADARFTLLPDDGEMGEQSHSETARIENYAVCEVYLSAGQFEDSDKQVRRLDTNDDSHWLPGPVTGTEVIPLHLHNGSNAMLIRWTQSIAFKPRLDPQGEEILVLKGELSDYRGRYPHGTWIRNPKRAWQTWGGARGTIIYYKNGHFVD